MVNVNKLKGKIVEKGLTISFVAKSIGIDTATFYRRIHKQGKDFTISEADNIAKLLELSPLEATSIFFSQFVA